MSKIETLEKILNGAVIAVFAVPVGVGVIAYEYLAAGVSLGRDCYYKNDKDSAVTSGLMLGMFEGLIYGLVTSFTPAAEEVKTAVFVGSPFAMGIFRSLEARYGAKSEYKKNELGIVE
jgi:hypothetical protein